ncbi:MAG: Hsp33 family molecular chaperone HslO [Alphaproteobacteria bacterium]
MPPPETSAPNDSGRGDDFVEPFQIESIGGGVRGRLVRLGPLVDDILTRHDYPEPVARLLGEALTLTSALAAGLKFNGSFSLQAQGDGVVSLLVADVTADGEMRGYAKFDPQRLSAASVDSTVRAAGDVGLMGRGYLAFTADPGDDGDRYQGIVDLAGETLAQCAEHYFRQSEQIETRILAAAEPRQRPNGAREWRAGALMLQRLPTDEQHPGGARNAYDSESSGPVSDEDWNRAVMLMATSTADELTDATLPARRLLYRLYHEDGVRVFPRKALSRGCRCSEHRVQRILASLPRDDLSDLAEDGKLVMTCEFCSRDFVAELGADGAGADIRVVNTPEAGAGLDKGRLH